MRNGADYLEALRDGRTVVVDGEAVDDVVDHPAFQGISRSVAACYDTAADPANGMTFTSPETGTTANKMLMLPRSRAELEERREAIARWSRVTYGWFGRGPDHIASFVGGFASCPDLFEEHREGFGANAISWYRRIVEDDLFVTSTIIPPQVDRGGTAHTWDAELLQVGVLEERDGGFVLRGAQMLGTGTAVSDHVFVSCIKPLERGDERYAISCILPIAAEGLKVYCRRPYAPSKPSTFDYPLSTRFDETDALLVFDDVFVPWEDTFVYQDIRLVRDQFFATPAHRLGNNQAQIRFIEKLKFLAGLARSIAATNGIERLPPVREKLGELASLVGVVEGMLIASEAASEQHESGVEVPSARFLYSIMGLQSELYPRVLGILRELAGGGVIQVPSSYHELVNEATREDMARYMRSSGDIDAEQRIKLFKLVWDAVGSEFAGRHHQYEMFYAGAPFIVRNYSFMNYGYEEAVGRVDEFLAEYGLPDRDRETAGAAQ